LSDKQLIQVELIGRGHEGLPAFFEALPKESGWPPDTVLSLTDREPTEFERAERYVAALAEGQIVGALSLHPAAAGNYHRMHNLHFHIDVLPSWQGKGVGSALIRRLIDHAREEGFWRIYLGTLSWNQRALELFGRFGFRVEGLSRAAYRVKTRGGEEYFLDGIGMALWIGPRLELAPGGWKLRASAEEAKEGEPVFALDGELLTEELVELHRAAGDLRHRFPRLVKAAWRQSDLVITARVGGRLVGAARGLCDRASTLFVCDLLVHPELRRQGIGSELMRRLVAPYADIYQIVLLTDPETMPFYERLGYMSWEYTALQMHPPKPEA
jgi:GNAT superfamily N-acetyltransferase